MQQKALDLVSELTKISLPVLTSIVALAAIGVAGFALYVVLCMSGRSKP